MAYQNTNQRAEAVAYARKVIMNESGESATVLRLAGQLLARELDEVLEGWRKTSDQLQRYCTHPNIIDTMPSFCGVCGKETV